MPPAGPPSAPAYQVSLGYKFTHTAYGSVPSAGLPSAPAYQVSLGYKFILTQHTVLCHTLVHHQHQLIRYVSCTSSHSHSIPFCATLWSTFSTSLSGKSLVQVHTHTAYGSVPPAGPPSAPAYQVSLRYKFTLTQHTILCHPLVHLQHQLIR